MAKPTDGSTVQVEQRIAGTPEELYDLVSDVTNMGRWSPETHACQWIGGATGPAVGARFRGANRRGRRRWSTKSTVVTAHPGRRFAFEVALGPFTISRWTYEFEPDGDGTRVVERWEDHRPSWMRRTGKVVMGVPDQAAHNRAGMEATLGALRASVEGGA